MERRISSVHGALIGAAAVLLALSLTLPRPAAAVTFPNLYRLTVMPDPAAPDQRAAAVELAMRRLLERITGKQDAGLDPALQDMVANAARYVASYAVLDRQRAQVGFFATEIDRELTARNQPVWGPERPLTMLWVAIDGGGGERSLLSADAFGAELSPDMARLTQEIRTQLLAVADERGLPVALPLLDLQDLDNIGFPDVWGGFDETIELASRRYAADASLVGRVRVTDLGTEVQWTLLRGPERRLLAGSGIAEGLHWLADIYAQDFSVLGGVRTVRMVVHDVVSLDDYGRVMSYLEGLSTLQTVDVESLDRGVLSLRAGARGDISVLERTFSLGRVLELAPSLAGDREAANTLSLSVARSEPLR